MSGFPRIGEQIAHQMSPIGKLISSKNYISRVLSMENDKIIQFLPLDDPGTHPSLWARDLSGRGNVGGFAAAGVTYLQPGMGGGKSVLLDGNDTYVQMPRVGVTTFDSDWQGNLYSFLIWHKIDSLARWSDLTTYRYPYHVRAADVTYYTTSGKSSAANYRWNWRRRTGGAIVQFNYDFTAANAPLDWFCTGLTCDQSIPELRAYMWSKLTGFVHIGTSNSANLTDWGANPPTDGTSLLGAGSLTLQEWIGNIQNGVTWAGVSLTTEQFRQVMVP